MKWQALIVITLLIISIAACTPPKPPCCEDIGGLDLHPINPEMMSQEQVKAVSNS
jgi:hypothetical protein